MVKNGKRWLFVILSFGLVVSWLLSSAGGMGSSALAADRNNRPVYAIPYTPKVLVDGRQINFVAYNIGNNGYFKLRDIAMALSGTEKSFSVEWSGERNAIMLTSGNPYKPQGGELTGKSPDTIEFGDLSTSTVYLDGKKLELTAYTIKGNNYFKLRDLAAALDFGVTWDAATQSVMIDSTAGYVPGGGTAPKDQTAPSQNGSSGEPSAHANAKLAYSVLFSDSGREALPLLLVDDEPYLGVHDLATLLSDTNRRFEIVRRDAKNRSYELATGRNFAITGAEEELRAKLIDFLDRNAKQWTVPVAASKMTVTVMVDGVSRQVPAYEYNGAFFLHARDLGHLLSVELLPVESVGAPAYRFVPNYPGTYRLGTESTDYAVRNILSARPTRWASIPQRYLYADASNQTLNLVTAYPWQEDVKTEDTAIEIRTYDREMNLISTKRVDFELPIFGAFYAGEQYLYIAFGQNNLEEDDGKEVIRIVKYDRDFNRLSSVSVYGGEIYTILPFDAGRGRMAEQGDTLVFHTSREKYATLDGVHHQMQLTFVINTPTMRVVNELGDFQSNHVSHSFDQYVVFDGNSHVLLDHGDASPRAIVLNKSVGSEYVELNLYNIPGPKGANATGVSVGGFEASSTHFLALFHTVDHSKVRSYTSYELEGYMEEELSHIRVRAERRDVMIAAVPRNQLSASQVEHITLYKYSDKNMTSSKPFMVRTGADRYMVLWNEYEIGTMKSYSFLQETFQLKGVRYLYVDGRGRPLGDSVLVEGYSLSGFDPIVYGDKVVWFSDTGIQQLLYTLPIR